MNAEKKDEQFELYELREQDLEQSPFKQFGKWFDEAQHKDHVLPNAFALATSDKKNRPSVRMLLMKDFSEHGFVFYTNSESRKGEELSQNQSASICFWWDRSERQVRIEGKIQVVDSTEADAYFKSRPRGSQIGAWASPQSSVIPDREVLEGRYSEIEEKYDGLDVPRPLYWNGYRLVPSSIEFWQGRPDRLHDRLRFTQSSSGKWIVERLAP